MKDAQITHATLLKRAVRWLTTTQHCGVVLSELKAYTTGNEIPDAIGFTHQSSTVVEIKISRADYFANREKYCSQTGVMVGTYRYFLVPAGLVTELDIRQDPALDSEYGLLWAEDHKIRIVRAAPHRFNRSWQGETAMLVSALRRVKTRDFITLVPEPSEESAA